MTAMAQCRFWDDDAFDGSRDNWGTPIQIFRRLNQDFAFEVDLAAEAWSAKCKRYLTKQDDALSYDWRKFGNRWLFLNPPFSDLDVWLEKVCLENDRGVRVVVLLPGNRIEQDWFHRCVMDNAAEVMVFRRRVKYIAPPGVSSSSPTFPSIAAVYMGRPWTDTILRPVL